MEDGLNSETGSLSFLTIAAGALTVSAEALLMGGTYSAYLYPEVAIAGTEFTRGALRAPNPFTQWTTAGRGARLLYEWWK